MHREAMEQREREQPMSTLTRLKEYIFDWPKEGQRVPTKFVLASDHEANDAAQRAQIEALERKSRDCDDHFKLCTNDFQRLSEEKFELQAQLAQAKADDQGHKAVELFDEIQRMKRSHALTQDGYTALRANYDTLSRQYQEQKQRVTALEVELGELKLRLNCPLAAPSCLLCGQVKPFVISHMEAAAIGICADCRDAQTALTASQQRVEELETTRQRLLDIILQAKEALGVHASVELVKACYDKQTALTAAQQRVEELEESCTELRRDREMFWQQCDERDKLLDKQQTALTTCRADTYEEIAKHFRESAADVTESITLSAWHLIASALTEQSKKIRQKAKETNEPPKT